MVASEIEDRRYFILAAVFSSCSVIGIFIGIIFEQLIAMDTSELGGESTSVGVVQAIVAGTFLYVSIVEIGMKEILVCRESTLLGNKICQNQMQWSKLAAFLIGYLAMSSLAIFV